MKIAVLLSTARYNEILINMHFWWAFTKVNMKRLLIPIYSANKITSRPLGH